MNKAQLRKELLTQRRALTLEQQQSAAQSAATIFTAHPLFKKSHHIATYVSRDAEFGSMPIIQEIWRAQKNCYLPALSTTQEKFLNFIKFESNDVLQPNRYKILEPSHSTIIPAEQLDLVLIPLVGFDLQGHRLGMGGGYYDRTFEFLTSNPAKKPLLIGLAYEAQCVDALPSDKWDVPLNGVLTEKGILLFG